MTKPWSTIATKMSDETRANNKLIAKQIKEDYFSEDDMDLMVMLIDFQFRLEHVEGELKQLKEKTDER